MAGHLTSRLPPLSPGLTTYVADVEAGIPSWYRRRESLLTELADGLTDTAERYLALGVSRPEAERRAVNDSGPAALSPRPSPKSGRPPRGPHRYNPAAHRADHRLLWLAALTPGQTPDHLLTRYPPLIPVLVGAVASAVLTPSSSGGRLDRPD